MSAVIISLRCLVIFLSATLVLGKLFGMNGVWAAYTVSESLTFVISLFMLWSKRNKLRKKGVNVNALLLDENVQNSIECYTYNCSKKKFDDYKSVVVTKLENNQNIDENIIVDVTEYINGSMKKVIVRDNLNHSDYKDHIEKITQNTSKSDYGPVLGWNRICLE